jgi:hypothetical protein
MEIFEKIKNELIREIPNSLIYYNKFCLKIQVNEKIFTITIKEKIDYFNISFLIWLKSEVIKKKFYTIRDLTKFLKRQVENSNKNIF